MTDPYKGSKSIAAVHHRFAVNSQKRVSELEAENATLQSQCASLKEALQFYEANWRDYCGDEGVPIGKEPNDRLRNDWGDKARAALQDEAKSDD